MCSDCSALVAFSIPIISIKSFAWTLNIALYNIRNVTYSVWRPFPWPFQYRCHEHQIWQERMGMGKLKSLWLCTNIIDYLLVLYWNAIINANTVEPHFSEHPWDQALMFVQEGLFVRSGVCIEFNMKNAWDRPESFIEEGCSPEQSVR